MPPYDTLNAAWNVGDSDAAVQENLARMKAALRLDRLAAACQVHGDTIHVVDERPQCVPGNGSPDILTPPGDALVTRLSGTGLLIRVADCQAVFLVDPVQGVIANVHCGWRGSVIGILPRVVELLADRFGTHPGDLLAAISPSLGPCCAEFRNYRKELPPSFHSYQVRSHYFDFWAISRSQLTGAGLKPGNIEVAERCTVCGCRDFFSYRAEGVTGRMAAVIAWKGGMCSTQG